jgi:CRP-like cAMP-binding protein
MAIEDDIAFFERVPTLSLLGRAALRILAIGAETRYVHTGEVLFYAGDPADAGFVVQEGQFSIAPNEAEGGESGETGAGITVGPGTLLGELALLTATTRPGTVTALEPSTVLRIPRSLFLKMLEGYPDAAKRLRDSFATRTDQAARDIYAVRSSLDTHESN